MRLGSKSEVAELLPVAKLTRLAVSYANCDHITPDRLEVFRPAIRDICQGQLQFHVVGPNARPNRLPTKWASRPDWHAWAKELIKCAAGERRLTEPLANDLHDLIARWQPLLDVYYDSKRGLDSVIVFPGDADLLWYVALGCAALVDRDSPYKGLVRRCPNFDGSMVNGKLYPGSDCRGYALLRSSEGKRDKYCSETCRNRVNVRNAAKKRREADKQAMHRKRAALGRSP